jgi:hypothetical protein
MSQSDILKFRKSNEVQTLIPAKGKKCKKMIVLSILKYLALQCDKNGS